jgi:hypothetical protein
MTNLREVRFSSEALDAFGRQRVSSPTLLLDNKQVGGAGGDLLSTTEVTGSGATSYQINRSSTFLTVGPAAGTAVRQTKSRAVYQAGKSLRLFETFVLNSSSEANLRQRCGYFDPKNGVYFQEQNGTLSMVIRSFVTGAVVEEVVPQSEWNKDKLDGTGPSKVTLNHTKAQIFAMDLEWLAVGTVAVGFVIDRELIYCHFFHHANIIDSAYMQNPNLPIRWEIEATGTITGTATLESICGSVDSEGGYDITGVSASADRGLSTKTITGGAIDEILSVRMQSGFTEFSTAFMQLIAVLANSSSNFLWRLVLNPTETAAGAWVPITSSIMEYNLGRTITPNTGFVVGSGYVSSDVDTLAQDERPVLTFGTDLAGVADVFSLQVGNLSGGNEQYLGSMTWREIF